MVSDGVQSSVTPFRMLLASLARLVSWYSLGRADGPPTYPRYYPGRREMVWQNVAWDALVRRVKCLQ